MSSRHGNRWSIVFASVLGVLLVPTRAAAWKVTTHMIIAERSAAALEDAALRHTLVSNIDYLRAGSIGPDVFYAPHFRNPVLSPVDSHYSDLAHYCRTGALALALIAGAGNDERLKAFAYGWLSHNVREGPDLCVVIRVRLSGSRSGSRAITRLT